MRSRVGRTLSRSNDRWLPIHLFMRTVYFDCAGTTYTPYWTSLLFTHDIPVTYLHVSRYRLPGAILCPIGMNALPRLPGWDMLRAGDIPQHPLPPTETNGIIHRWARIASYLGGTYYRSPPWIRGVAAYAA